MAIGKAVLQPDVQLQHVQNTRHHDYQVEVPKYLRMKMFSLVE